MGFAFVAAIDFLINLQQGGGIGKGRRGAHGKWMSSFAIWKAYLLKAQKSHYFAVADPQ